MTFTKEKAKENLSRLIAKFERELAAGKIKEYNEEAAKIAFIQPLLKDVLGWDVNDHDEVSPEERTSRGRVDYGLKVEGKIKIFIEAKPPKVDLVRHIEQAIRYGYNRKGVPFVLLTDFEALKLFDVTVKPDIRNPLKGLKLDLEYLQYLDQFDRIWQLSKESVISGKLDDLLRIKPKDRLPVDKAILEDLKRWREILAKDIFKYNQGLFHSENREKDANYLKEITQKILDRIIFMRSCEDRGLYHGDKLKAVFEERSDTVGTNTMVFLKKEFESYNIFFDSDLFRPNEWEANLAVDFNVMKEIVLGTYNPYQFDVIPLEVLGNIYEQYLGYTIRLTDHQVKYELKPEVRKAGGVYYTPEYIVDYIVKNTVGKLLEESPPSKAKKLRILDPACGSGSFLIRAYEEMLNYYREQKTKKAKPGEGEIKLELPDEKLRLKIHEKKDILINHIFGVDIDEQAVEVTKLSLMLKMLDGERGIPAGRGILPMLDKNIKCGNSLISGNPLELHKYFGEDWYKVKPFNWEDEFPQIMKDEGGFDVVIGNPPYIRIQGFSPDHLSYLAEHFFSAKGNFDQYISFIERGYSLLKSKGIFGEIVPNKFIKTDYGRALREFLSNNNAVHMIIDFGADQVFKVTNYTCLLFLLKQNNKEFYYAETQANEVALNRTRLLKKESSVLDKNPWIISTEKASLLSIKLSFKTIRLLDLPVYMNRGSSTGADDIFLINNTKAKLDNSIIRKPIFATDFNRYIFSPTNDWQIIFPYDEKDNYRLYKEEELRDRFPKAYAYLKANQVALKKRKQFKEWFGYSAPRNLALHDSAQIIIPLLADRGKYSIIPKFYSGKICPMASSGFTITIPHTCPINKELLLGILNSSLLFWKLKQISNIFRGGWITCTKQYFGELPIRLFDVHNSEEKKIQNDIIGLVNILIELHIRKKDSKGLDGAQLQRQIEITDRKIDDLVYNLYKINEEERRVIESNIK